MLTFMQQLNCRQTARGDYVLGWGILSGGLCPGGLCPVPGLVALMNKHVFTLCFLFFCLLVVLKVFPSVVPVYHEYLSFESCDMQNITMVNGDYNVMKGFSQGPRYLYAGPGINHRGINTCMTRPLRSRPPSISVYLIGPECSCESDTTFTLCKHISVCEASDVECCHI